MAITKKIGKTLRQQEHFERAYFRLLNFLSQCFNIQLTSANSNSSSKVTVDSIASNISKFSCEPDSGYIWGMVKTLGRYFSKWIRGKHVCLSENLSQKQPKDLDSTLIGKQQNEIIGDQFSLFNVRFICLKSTKHETDNYLTSHISSTVNAKNFKCSHLQKISLNAFFFRWTSITTRCKYSYSIIV